MLDLARALSQAQPVDRARTRWRALLARPLALLALAAIVAVAAFQLWISPSNPPGFIRDEASLAYDAYSISQSLRDQDGALLPLYLRSFDDYKSPIFVYLLAGVFRVTGPSQTVARGLGAVDVLAAVLLLGLIAFRRSRDPVVAVVVLVLAGTTPWLFELGRVAYEATLEPFLICLLLLLLDRALRRRHPAPVSAVPVGLALGALTYVYAGGRLLGPLFAAALVVCAGRGRWRWLLTAWATFAVSLAPLAVYSHRHPGALTARYERTTYVEPGMSPGAIVWRAFSNYVHDVNLWYWIRSGDPKPYIHAWGAGSLFGSVVLLAALGAFLVLRRRRDDLWWRYVVAAVALAPIPAALTGDRFYALRLVQLPVLLLVLAIPGLALVVEAARQAWPARALAAGLTLLVAAQFAHFLHVYRTVGPRRVELFEAGVPVLLREAFDHDRTVYVDYDDRYAQTHLLWYAAAHGIPRSRVQILPDGGIPPVGSMVFGRYQTCDYVCVELDRSYSY